MVPQLQDNLRWQFENLPQPQEYEQHFRDWQQQMDKTLHNLRREVQRLREEFKSKLGDEDSSEEEGELDGKPVNSSEERSSAHPGLLSDHVLVNNRLNRTPLQSVAPRGDARTNLSNQTPVEQPRFQYFGRYFQIPPVAKRDYATYRPPYFYPQQREPYYNYHYYPGDVYYGRLLYYSDPRWDVQWRAYDWSGRTY